MKIIEELCLNVNCRESWHTHWHPLSVASLAKEKLGQYTITIRVRSVRMKPRGQRART
jgi:hypothetical protein